MENTAFSTKLPLIPECLPKLSRQRLCRGVFWSDPKVRPPFLDEMMPDIERVIASVAQRYCDTTTPHLQFDELVGEGRLKLSELITKGELTRQVCRYDFFRFFKTSVNNQARSRVQKYRFTEKRTGVKPPPREERFKPTEGQPEDQPEEHHQQQPEHHKNVELSLDDPELNIQVPQGEQENERDSIDLMEDYEALLEDIEKMVFRQMVKPNEKARCYALMDAQRRRVDEKLHVKIKPEHMAIGLGMRLGDFENTVLTIRQKISDYRMMTEEQQDTLARRCARVATLKELFNLQLPPNLDDMVMRRLFTMAARDQYDEKVKGKPQVEEMLLEVGAKPPSMIGDKMACYGVLYQKNCRKCNMCDLRHSCAVEAANLGLTKMAISPRLLGAKQPRIPAFLPRTSSDDARISSADEGEIVAHLDETFKKMDRNGTPYYYLSVGSVKKRRFLFCVEQSSPLKLRFWNPSESLKKRLTGKQKTWYVREDAMMSEIIELIEQHAKDTFE